MAEGMGQVRTLIVEGRVWDGEVRSWRDADIAIDGPHIAAVGADLPRRGDEQVIDARGKLVIPGLVNTHTHGHNNLLKGTGDCRWLEGHINAMTAVGRWSPRDLYVSTMVGIIEMLCSGTTVAYDMVRAPTDEHVAAAVQAYLDAGMRAVIAPAITDLPFVDSVPGLADRLPPDVVAAARASGPPSADTCLAFAERAVRAWHSSGDGLIAIAVAPLTADSCSDELIARAAQLARRLGVGTHMHLLESKYQAVNGVRRSGGATWVEHLAALRYLGPEATLAHGVWLTGPELTLLADSGSTIAHNPASNLKLGSGLAPIAEYLSAGVNVGLGTDGSASGDTLDMFSAMWLAAMMTHSRTPRVDRWLTAADVFDLATVRGARSLGHHGRIGTLTSGALADVVVINPDNARLTPLNDAMTQLVYCGVGGLVETVLVNGRVVVENSAVVGLDEHSLLDEARQAAVRLGTAEPLSGSQAIIQARLDELQRGIGTAAFAVNRFTATTNERSMKTSSIIREESLP
jgi:5-methylthioadenosine/S-adenosylhomocysteine deaminase